MSRLFTAFLTRRFRLLLSRTSSRRSLAPSGLAVETTSAGSRSPARPRGGVQAGRLGRRAARGGRGALPAALALTSRTCTSCHSFARVSMKGRRVRVPTPGTKGRQACFGALSCRQWAVALCRPGAPVGCPFRRFSSATGGCLPRQAPGAGARPGARAYRQSRPDLAEPPIRASPCVSLPNYAAHELHPAERIGGLMKSAVEASRLAGNIGELVAAARRFFTDLAPHPVKLPTAA